ncbi:MAG: AbrB/MazE/SpoVT family DNA-binding domain-containing protein [Alphaproteobacteria bacterium]|nr:AbrB/MazE/SpoVT family DNA-binding domain-containing protein [Alphaproteobacteria bacterium]
MRITSKGQVTIPVHVRSRAGLLPNTEVDFVLKGNTVYLVKMTKGRKATPMREWLRRARGSATVKMTTEQIMKLTRDW